MKLLFENWRGYLNEISFSAASAFEFDDRRWENKAYVYRFSDHEDETYEVLLTPTDGGSIISWDIGYKAEHGEYYELTGKGIVVKIMATVAQIVLDFIKRPDRPIEDQKRIFYFSGALGPGEVEHSGPQSAGKRTRLYTYMLKKMLPAGWDMSEDMDTPNAMWFFNEKELGTLSEHEEDFINSLGANIKDIKDKIKQPGMQGAPEEEEDDDMTFSDPFGLLHENWRRYLKENKEDYAESVETAELEMIQELLDASETFRAAWKEMEQSIEGTSHHFGETTAEHTRNVLKELDIIIDSMDEEIDAVRKRKLRLAAALHDIAKPPTRTVDDSGRVRFFGHPSEGVSVAEKVLREIGQTDKEIIIKIVKMHMDILFKADELRRGVLKKEERAVNRFLNKIGNGLEDLYLVAQANVNAIVRPEGAKVVPGRDWEKFKSDMEEHIDYQRQWMEKARAAYQKRNIDEPDLEERKLTPGELKKREEYAKDLPDDEFKERYGKDWMSVKMATATKMAKK